MSFLFFQNRRIESDYCKANEGRATENDIKGINLAEESKSILTRPQPIDWTPDEKCNFCVNGKLLKVNEIGELVVEAGPPVHPESELNKHVSFDFKHRQGAGQWGKWAKR